MFSETWLLPARDQIDVSPAVESWAWPDHCVPEIANLRVLEICWTSAELAVWLIRASWRLMLPFRHKSHVLLTFG